MNNVNVKNQSVAYQGFFIRFVMLFLPLLITILSFFLSSYPSKGVLFSVGLGIGSIIVLLLVSFQNKIISRWLLVLNIYWLILSVGDLLFGYWKFRESYFYVALFGVVFYTMNYSVFGFIGKQYKNKINTARASYLLFGLWSLGLIAERIKYLFDGSVAIALNFVSGFSGFFYVSGYLFLRFIVLYLFDETNTESMKQRVIKVSFGSIFFLIISYYTVPFLYTIIKNALPTT